MADFHSSSEVTMVPDVVLGSGPEWLAVHNPPQWRVGYTAWVSEASREAIVTAIVGNTLYLRWIGPAPCPPVRVGAGVIPIGNVPEKANA